MTACGNKTVVQGRWYPYDETACNELVTVNILSLTRTHYMFRYVRTIVR
jgi:hypothetical protein